MGVANKRTVTKTRRKTRDVDQVKADLASAKHLAQFKNSKATEDLPGLGRNYCTECAKWFDTETALLSHRRGKPHKRRVKQLREEPDAEKLPGNHATSNAQRQQFTSTVHASADVKMAT